MVTSLALPFRRAYPETKATRMVSRRGFSLPMARAATKLDSASAVMSDCDSSLPLLANADLARESAWKTQIKVQISKVMVGTSSARSRPVKASG